MGYSDKFCFKIFNGIDYSLLEKQVNDYIAEKKLIYFQTQMVVFNNEIVISLTYEEDDCSDDDNEFFN